MKAEVALQILAGEFGEAFLLALVAEYHRDLPAIAFPVVELAEEILPPGFFQHEIASLEGPQRTAETGEGEILLAIILRRILEDSHVRSGDLGVVGNDQVLLAAVVVHRGFGRGFGEQQVGLGQFPGGRLRIEIELADGFEIGVEKLQPQGFRRLPGKEIEDAAADGKLSTPRDGGNPFVAVLGQGFRQLRRIEAGARFQGRPARPQGVGRGGFSGKGVTAANDDAAFRAGEDFQYREPFGGGFRIGDGAVAGFHRAFRKDQRGDTPEFQL